MWEDTVLSVVGGILAIVTMFLVIIDITLPNQQGFIMDALFGLVALVCFVTANALQKLQKMSDRKKPDTKV